MVGKNSANGVISMSGSMALIICFITSTLRRPTSPFRSDEVTVTQSFNGRHGRKELGERGDLDVRVDGVDHLLHNLDLEAPDITFPPAEQTVQQSAAAGPQGPGHGV